MNTYVLPLISIESRALVFTLLHSALAAAVTIHALVTKRDVPAAIGWIGMAWLSPFFGAILYAGFGINRVKRRARRLRGSEPNLYAAAPADLQSSHPVDRLKCAVGRITGLDLQNGRVADILNCGDEAYPAMLAAIDSAKSSIALSTFIFRADEIGLKFVEALARAHRRGVLVRVLIDGIGGGFLSSPAFHHLRSHGIAAARFLHSTVPWKMPLLDLRLHKKVLLVDGQTAFVGGLNIGAENLTLRHPDASIRDIHFRIEGPVVRQIAEDFAEDWSFTTGEALDGPDWLPDDIPSGEAQCRAIASGPDQDLDQLVLVLLSAVNAARHRIRIVTPYFLPDEQLMTALELAALRGVAVDIVLPAVNNHRLVAWAAQANVRPLLQAGCRLWRAPPPFDHSKLMTFDGEWSLIGSANWDMRSLRLNFELTVEFYDETLAQKLATIIDGKCKDRLTLSEIDGRWFIVKLRDAAARLMTPYI